MAGRTSVDIDAERPVILLVPLGATEQHGPHLPLGTDTTVAEAWVGGVAQSLTAGGYAVAAAPALPYGSSGEHQDFAGTLSIGQAALVSVVIELCRSAASSFDAVVLLSGHAGNAEALDQAVTRLRSEGHQVLHLLAGWPDDPGHPPIDAHAGRTETSLMLHLSPGDVRLDRARPGATAPVSTLMDAMRSGGIAAVSANGVLGDPAGATAEDGRRLLDDLVARSAEIIAAWIDRSG